MVLNMVLPHCIVVNTLMKALRVLWEVPWTPPAQSSVMDAEQRLQATLQSLDNTDIHLLEVPVPEDSRVAQADVPVSITGDTATVRQTDLDGLGDFVNLRQTPNA
jgi:hypothetical protein